MGRKEVPSWLSEADKEKGGLKQEVIRTTREATKENRLWLEERISRWDGVELNAISLLKKWRRLKISKTVQDLVLFLGDLPEYRSHYEEFYEAPLSLIFEIRRGPVSLKNPFLFELMLEKTNNGKSWRISSEEKERLSPYSGLQVVKKDLSSREGKQVSVERETLGLNETQIASINGFLAFLELRGVSNFPAIVPKNVFLLGLRGGVMGGYSFPSPSDGGGEVFYSKNIFPVEISEDYFTVDSKRYSNRDINTYQGIQKIISGQLIGDFKKESSGLKRGATS